MPQLASLADTRGVVRLSGHGLIDFLQVSYDDHNLLSQVLICWLSAEKPRLTFCLFVDAGPADKRCQTAGGQRGSCSICCNTEFTWQALA